ncbi:MAG: ribosomal-processing cysteine protease Prp [Lachnospiraceae bacterium]|nr:ribosomal-processing cysteine protease Prp [Lachnospiraceae bacterium]
MISITVFEADHQYKGFLCKGHAGYAEEGYDIICSAVSVMTVNTINSLEQLTEDELKAEQAPDGGYLKLELPGKLSREADVLMKSLVLGLQTIEENYGSEFVKVQIRKCRENR